ncbi:multidrug effflux MFS transporter [Bartonella sp. DGB1]|uniref:multidrug effflux MFS transporter n=1 Tax=Bartonella sp. DGB1 TaxID=3239807 RepID=UPI0035248F85
MSNITAKQQQHIDNVKSKIGTVEFIFLMSLLMASNALAIDIMLPAFSSISNYFSLQNANHIQYIIFSYLLGYAFFQLLFGSLSDRYGRKNLIILGMIIYVFTALACALVFNFWVLLVLRFIQGIGAATTKVLTVAIVRDIYSGKEMARIMSFAAIVFMIVPILAPAFGFTLLSISNQAWQTIFLFMAFGGLLLIIWTYIRLPETLFEKRALTFNNTRDAFKIVFSNRICVNYTLAISFIMGGLFGSLLSCEQIFNRIYHLESLFPIAFASIAIFLALASFNNTQLLKKFNIKNIANFQLLSMMCFSASWLTTALIMDEIPFIIFMFFYVGVMYSFGGLAANLNSIALEPLGKVAGTASSITNFSQTIIGALLGIIIGQSFNNTTIPLASGFLICNSFALLSILIVEKGKLFSKRISD